MSCPPPPVPSASSSRDEELRWREGWMERTTLTGQNQVYYIRRYISSTGNGQWLKESSRHCPIFVHTDRQTDTMFALIYKIEYQCNRKKTDCIIVTHNSTKWWWILQHQSFCYQTYERYHTIIKILFPRTTMSLLTLILWVSRNHSPLTSLSLEHHQIHFIFFIILFSRYYVVRNVVFS